MSIIDSTSMAVERERFRSDRVERQLMNVINNHKKAVACLSKEIRVAYAMMPHCMPQDADEIIAACCGDLSERSRG